MARLPGRADGQAFRIWCPRRLREQPPFFARAKEAQKITEYRDTPPLTMWPEKITIARQCWRTPYCRIAALKWIPNSFSCHKCTNTHSSLRLNFPRHLSSHHQTRGTIEQCSTTTDISVWVYLKILVDGLVFRFDAWKLVCFSGFLTEGTLLLIRKGGGVLSVLLSLTLTASIAFSGCAAIDGSILRIARFSMVIAAVSFASSDCTWLICFSQSEKPEVRMSTHQHYS